MRGWWWKNRSAATSLPRRSSTAILEKAFPESAIFRIDHFLGKEPVQNILYTRFANFFFEPVWNRTHIRAIQITMAEDFGVKGRGAFYEEAGCIRDVVQNHLLQILACLTMDPPRMQVPDSIRDEKSRVLRAVRPLAPDDIVRGQFNGYKKEKGVAADSDVETYAARALVHRHVALGGCAVLHSRGEMPAGDGDGSGGGFQEASARDVRREGDRAGGSSASAAESRRF